MTEITNEEVIQHAFWSGYNMGRSSAKTDDNLISVDDCFDEIIMVREHRVG
jgi:hypothetical protein